MKRKSLNESEIRTVLAVFYELQRKSYDELNTYLGSETIKEMTALNSKLDKWYKRDVLNMEYDEEMGWYDPADQSFDPYEE